MRIPTIPAISRNLSAAFAEPGRLALGPAAIDGALAGGLDRHRLHEIVPDGIFQLGAAAGFALALAVRQDHGGAIVWIQQRRAALEGGAPYGLGLAPFAIAPSRLLLVQADAPNDALWTMEESLRCGGVAAVIGELSGAGEAADLTATRRLNLVAETHGALGLLLRQQPLKGTSACATRWRVAGAPGSGDDFGGIGRIAFALTLEKNRQGPCGAWTVEWDCHDGCFRAALPVAMAAPPCQRPHRAA
jgi:protein ImuA